MAILVTGGAGYIGSVAVDDLVDNGQRVVVLDDLSRGHRSSVNDETRFYQGDIADRTLISRICRENAITAAMHFSAFAYVGESVDNPQLYYNNNTVKTIAFLDELLAWNVRKIVFSSTCAVYGEPQALPITEEHPLQPENPYGRSKLFIEQVLRDYDRSFGLSFVSLRYFNACGATKRRGEMHHPETHLIPLILDVAEGKRSHLTVFGDDHPTSDGTAIRDYIHVSDISRAHLLALGHLDRHGSSTLVNLGNGKGFSVLEVVEAARKVTRRRIEVVIGPKRPGDPSRLISDWTRARELFGWEPSIISIEEMIGSAWAGRQRLGIDLAGNER